MSTTKLLISLPINADADRYFGKDYCCPNKPADSGVDLPSVYNYHLPSSVHGHNILVDFYTVFAMYDTKFDGMISSLKNLAYLYGNLDVVSENGALKFLLGVLKPMAYMIAPRSSISKTPFRLANSVGIIDSTYKGYSEKKPDTIKASFDFIPALYDNDKHKPRIDAGDRLVQIISPDLSLIYHHRLSFCSEDIDFWSKYISTSPRGGLGSTNV